MENLGRDCRLGGKGEKSTKMGYNNQQQLEFRSRVCCYFHDGEETLFLSLCNSAALDQLSQQFDGDVAVNTLFIMLYFWLTTIITCR